MIFFRQNVLIYLKRQGLAIYIPGKPKLSFDFSPDTVLAEEIKDKEKLQTQLADFLKNNGLVKLQTVVVLAEELTFQKNLAEKEKFLEELPFSKEKIVSQDYPAKKLVIATNGELFNILLNIITESGGKILSVAPVTLLGVSSIDENNFRLVLNNKRLLGQSDLLNTQYINKNIGLSFLLILILVVVSLGGGLYYYFRPAKKVPPEILKEPIKQVTPTKEATISAIISPKAKKGLEIKVLNGTGTAGDAKKVKDALEALGYQNIETDNLEVQNATSPAIIYSSSAVSYLPEITSVLQKLFKLKPLAVSTDSASFDLKITTGK